MREEIASGAAIGYCSMFSRSSIQVGAGVGYEPGPNQTLHIDRQLINQLLTNTTDP
jgi:hypothetical protein